MSKIQNETNSQRIAFSGKFGNSEKIDHLNPNLINIINRGLQDVKCFFLGGQCHQIFHSGSNHFGIRL